MICEKIVLVNKLGLHARASAKLAQHAGQFSSSIEISLDDSNFSDCKSIMALMMMAASVGTEMTLRVEGDDEHHAFEDICALINDKFGEGE